MQADGKAWLFVPAGLVDGPLPAHYEPQESPFPNLLYGQQRNPVRQIVAEAAHRYQPSGDQPGSSVFPYVGTTYRLTEHHTAGGHVAVRCPTWPSCSRSSSARCPRSWRRSAA